jgi:integrase
MVSKKFNFTQVTIEALPLPDKGKRAYYRDEKEDGLVIDVRPSGSKSFYLYKKINGRPERVLIGPYPDVKIPEARKKAAMLKGQIAAGNNPQEEKRQIRQEITLGEIFKDYMDRYSKVHKKSWEYDEREIPVYFGHWFKRRLSSITKHEVRELVESIYNKKFKKNGISRGGHYQANRALERLRALYNKAIEWGWQGDNPTTGIKKYKEVSRDRFIHRDEFTFLLEALDVEENHTARDYILMSLMTGARKTNVLQMRWEQIDWYNNVWRIPDTKNGEPQNVVLVERAVQILNQRRSMTNSPWVFPSDVTDGHFADPKKSWSRVRQRATLALWKLTPEYAALINDVESKIIAANNYVYTVAKLYDCVVNEADKRNIEIPTGLMDLRLHDIRRTFGSWQVMTGASLHVVGMFPVSTCETK